jgi:hypothetical protein
MSHIRRRASPPWMIATVIAALIALVLTFDANAKAGPAAVGGAATPSSPRALRLALPAPGAANAGTVVANVFHSSLASGLARAGASVAKISAIERILAQNPATRAKAAASARPEDVAQVTRIAKHAITHGIAMSYTVAAAVMLVAALVAWLRLRKIAYTDDEPPAPSASRPPTPHAIARPRR